MLVRLMFSLVAASFGVGALLPGRVLCLGVRLESAPGVSRRYRATVIAPLPGSDGLVAKGINGRGEVVGYCYKGVAPGHVPPVSHAFRWVRGRMEALPTLGGDASSAVALNDHGDIVGDAETRDTRLAVVWPAGGVRAPIALSSARGFAQAINRNGDIAGVEVGAHGWRLVLWQRGRRRERQAPGGLVLRVTGMDDRGGVVGYTAEKGPFSIESNPSAFLWHDGKLEMLPTLGDPRSEARAVSNDAGIVGWSVKGNARRACVWRAGVLQDLGTLGGGSAGAEAIAPNGAIVGGAETSAGVGHACAWFSGQVVDLNDRVSGAPATLENATGINEAGDIIAETSDHRWLVLTPEN
jgi:probable HAF family extracellular repeat protein